MEFHPFNLAQAVKAQVKAEQSSRELQFVTFSNPDDMKSRKFQKTIRRHARQHASTTGAKGRRPISYVFDLPASQSGAADGSTLPNRSINQRQRLGKTTAEPQSRHVDFAKLLETLDVQSILRPLGAGLGLNPLVPFPIPLESQHSVLIDYLISDAKENSRPMFKIWISIALDDHTAFRLLLYGASSRLHQSRGLSPENNKEAVMHYTRCLHEMNSRLQDSQDSVSQGLIGAVLGFACQDSQLGYFDRWAIHMRGLRRMVEHRGGMSTLSTAYALRLSILWIDINGCIPSDTTPHFPLPLDILKSLPTIRPSSILESLLQSLAGQTLSDIGETIISVALTSKYMNGRGHLQGFWEDQMVYFHRFLPMAYQVLALTKYDFSIPASTAQITQELVRKTYLLYLALVKRRFNVSPDSVEQTKHGVLEFLREHDVEWIPQLRIVQLWVDVILAIAVSDESSIFYTTKVARKLDELSIVSWAAFSELLEAIGWIDEVFKNELAVLLRQVNVNLK